MTLRRALATGGLGCLAAGVLALAQTVSVTVTAVNNALTITAATISAGEISSTRAFDVTVNTQVAATVTVRLDAIQRNAVASSIPAGALSLTARASGASGTSNVVVDPFPAFATGQDITAAFGQLGQSVNETSQIDVTVHLDQLGDLAQNDSLSFNLTFVVTESL